MAMKRRNGGGGGGGGGPGGGEEETPPAAPSYPKYFVVRHEKGGFSDLLVSFVSWKRAKEMLFEDNLSEWETLNELGHRWVILLSIVVRKIIDLLRKPMEFVGVMVEFFLNLLVQNGGVLGLGLNFLTGRLVVPQRGSGTFISAIGHLDRRMDLRRCEKFSGVDPYTSTTGGGIDFESNAVMDLCMMGSKLAYENENVVRNVITIHWKMHFVHFYNCWDDNQKDKSTQVFILSDKAKDANFILVSFRGTEPFDADDWITDWDYSWCEIPSIGKVHMGFLEALGMVNRDDPNSLSFRLGRDRGKEEENTAYQTLRRKLESLLDEHPSAKFLMTGHSLGGALAILFPTLLLYHEEQKLMGRMLGVYTFGQPRIGDRDVGLFMEAHVCRPSTRYRRVVYCNDAVPRLPYDDNIFLYRHFGSCLYFNSFYKEKETEEVPNRNYLMIRYLLSAHLNAIWELGRSFFMGWAYGSEYKEGCLGVMVRLIGLMVPGISAHAPRDYINCVRLGKK